MLKKIGLGFVAVIVLLVVFAYALPREVHVERSVVIVAAPEAIYPLLVNLKAGQAWSPWAGKDPDAKYTFEGPDAGVGCKMSWSGNSDVGVGTQVVTAVQPNKRVETELDFGDQGKAKAFFILEDKGGKTTVTWGLDTDMGNNPIGRWMGLFMDGMVGTDYEKGLANLKALVEKKA